MDYQLGYLKVATLGQFNSRLDFFNTSDHSTRTPDSPNILTRFEVPENFYAREIWWPIKVYTNSPSLQKEIHQIPMAQPPNNSAFGVKFVDEDEANLLLIVEKGNVSFKCGNIIPDFLDSDAEGIVKEHFLQTVKETNTHQIIGSRFSKVNASFSADTIPCNS